MQRLLSKPYLLGLCRWQAVCGMPAFLVVCALSFILSVFSISSVVHAGQQGVDLLAVDQESVAPKIVAPKIIEKKDIVVAPAKTVELPSSEELLSTKTPSAPIDVEKKGVVLPDVLKTDATVVPATTAATDAVQEISKPASNAICHGKEVEKSESHCATCKKDVGKAIDESIDEAEIVSEESVNDIADADIMAVSPSSHVVSKPVSSVSLSEVTKVTENQVTEKTSVTHDYKLQPGDKLRLTVFGEQELSTVYKVDGAGMIAMPLVGSIKVQGLSVLQIKDMLEEQLANGYLVDPSIAVEVSEYRPVFLMGEVRAPGSYAYMDGMTVLEAIAMGGGYTYRADDDDIEIVRDGYTEDNPLDAKASDVVLPGDVITVKERFF